MSHAFSGEFRLFELLEIHLLYKGADITRFPHEVSQLSILIRYNGFRPTCPQPSQFKLLSFLNNKQGWNECFQNSSSLRQTEGKVPSYLGMLQIQSYINHFYCKGNAHVKYKQISWKKSLLNLRQKETKIVEYCQVLQKNFFSCRSFRDTVGHFQFLNMSQLHTNKRQIHQNRNTAFAAFLQSAKTPCCHQTFCISET